MSTTNYGNNKIQKCRDLEIQVRGHSRLLKVVLFDRLGTVSCYCSIETLSLRCTVFEILDLKNAVTLKTVLGIRQGHWKCHHGTYDFLLAFYSNYGSILCLFWDIQCRKMSWPWNLGQRSLKVIGTYTDRPAAYVFLLTFHSDHGPVSHRFRDKRRFQSKIPIFSHPCILHPAEGFPLGIGYRSMVLKN